VNPKERLFYGVPMPAEVAQRIAPAVDANVLIAKRAGPPANWHITLRFLGATDPDRKEKLRRAVDDATLPEAFEARIASWGVFPRPAAARVFWVGVEDSSGTLGAIASTLELLARTAGFPPEERKFKPHITLARFRDPLDLRPALKDLPEIDARFTIGSIVLFRSHLGSGPARYERLFVHRLPG
jgi:2'-5' RNA ligase